MFLLGKIICHHDQSGEAAARVNIQKAGKPQHTLREARIIACAILIHYVFMVQGCPCQARLAHE